MNKITFLKEWLTKSSDNTNTINCVEKLEEINVKTICRSCLSDDNLIYKLNQLIKFDETQTTLPLIDIIMYFTNIQIKFDDDLPQNICAKCFDLAWNSYLYKIQCEEADNVLKTYLNHRYNNAENNNEDKNFADGIVTNNINNNNNNDEIKIYELELPLQNENIINNLAEHFQYSIKDKILITNDDSRSIKYIVEENEQLNSQVSDNFEDDNQCIDLSDIENDRNTKETDLNESIEAKFSCKLCSEDFTTNLDLNKHNRNFHLIKNYKCKECNQTFTQKQSLGRHQKIHQSDQKNKLCTFCGKFFLRTDDLKRHIRTHTGERPYSCNLCPKKFKQTSELKEHSKTHLNEKNYMCTVCGKSLATRNGLYVHMKVHLGDKKHQCKICGNKYVTTGELLSHTKHIHSKEKPFHCTYDSCTKSFATKLSLQSHLVAHTGIKPHKCLECGKCLSTLSSLQIHKRIHTGIKPKHCTICDRRFSNSQSLKKHIRIHTGERPYECDICKSKFICGSTLTSHMKIKHLEKQYNCNICSKRFALNSKLKQHQRLHSNNTS